MAFGTSEKICFVSGGRLEIIETTDQVCPVCKDSAAGPTMFGVIRKTLMSVSMICPNCGQAKTVLASDYMAKEDLAWATEVVPTARQFLESEIAATPAVPKKVAKNKIVATRRKPNNKPAKTTRVVKAKKTAKISKKANRK